MTLTAQKFNGNSAKPDVIAAYNALVEQYNAREKTLVEKALEAGVEHDWCEAVVDILKDAGLEVPDGERKVRIVYEVTVTPDNGYAFASNDDAIEAAQEALTDRYTDAVTKVISSEILPATA